MSSDGSVCDDSRCAISQLLEVLVLSRIDGAKAVRQFDRLREVSLYDQATGYWRWAIAPDGRVTNASFAADCNLVAVLVESTFDKNAGRRLFDALRNSPLWDPQHQEWNRCVSPDGSVNSDRRAPAQLLGLIVETQIEGTATARKRYDELLNDGVLFDPRTRMWRAGTDKERQRTDETYYTHSQLLSIWAESLLVSTESVKLRLADLKKARQQPWGELWSTSTSNLSASPTFRSTDQLFGIICEQELESDRQLKEEVPPLPVVRSF
jgi:hypothetical protein